MNKVRISGVGEGVLQGSAQCLMVLAGPGKKTQLWCQTTLTLLWGSFQADIPLGSRGGFWILDFGFQSLEPPHCAQFIPSDSQAPSRAKTPIHVQIPQIPA